MDAKMEGLHINLPKSALSSGNTKTIAHTKVADSWEDEDVDSNAERPTDTLLKPVTSNDAGTHPPPPTPISPTSGSKYDWSTASVLGGGRPEPLDSDRPTSRSESDSERRRPEKTTAAAGRMIAASLGVRAPRKTEEQRQYDRAVREQEMKRKSREKEAQERARQEDEKAKVAVWDS